MTPKDRFLNALAGKPVDRTPVANPTSIVTSDLQEAEGISFPDAHFHAEQMAALAMAGHTRFGYDVVFPVFAGGTHEAEALGVPVRWGDKDHMPACEAPIWQRADDIFVPDDFLDHPAISTPIEAIRILSSEVGDRVGVVGKVYGPWSLAYHLFGLAPFLKMTIKDPGEVTAILEGLMEPAILFANAQIEAGADALCWGAHITADLIRPEAYSKFLMDIDQRLVAEINAPLILHCCGNTMDRIELFNESTMAAFHFESRNDPYQMKNKAAIPLIGNINNTVTLLEGSREDIKREVYRALDAKIDIIAPECAVPLNAPMDNIKAVAECVEDYYAEDRQVS